MGALEGWGVHQRHRPGITRASRLHSWNVLQATGGFSAPQRRRRRRCALTLAEREEISRGLAAGDSIRVIATRLRRCAWTVSREIERNGARRNYRATKTDERAWERAHRPKRCLLATNHHFLGDVVARKLREDCSPEQISGWLKKRYPDEEAMRVSHETIFYRALFVQVRGALKRELLTLICVPGR